MFRSFYGTSKTSSANQDPYLVDQRKAQEKKDSSSSYAKSAGLNLAPTSSNKSFPSSSSSTQISSTNAAIEEAVQQAVIVYEKKIQDLKESHERELISTAARNVLATTQRLQVLIGDVAPQVKNYKKIANIDEDFLLSEMCGGDNEEAGIDNPFILKKTRKENIMATDDYMQYKMNMTLMNCLSELAQRPKIIVHGKTLDIAPVLNERSAIFKN